MRSPWVVATRNAGKLRELRPLFAEASIDIIDLDEAGLPESTEEAAIECHQTFEENAVAKAAYFEARVGGLPVVADDSGLEVLALDGEPGVRSRRWSGRAELRGGALDAANNALLLRRLDGIVDRRARFVCAAAWRGFGESLVVRGETAGTIAGAGSGTEGFGYDSYFHADELGMTFGSAGPAVKQRVSHRARAFRALLRQLRRTE